MKNGPRPPIGIAQAGDACLHRDLGGSTYSLVNFRFVRERTAKGYSAENRFKEEELRSIDVGSMGDDQSEPARCRVLTHQGSLPR